MENNTTQVNVEYGNSSIQFYIPETNIPAFEKSLNNLIETLGAE